MQKGVDPILNGWIKIHWKLCEHWIWGNPVYLKWWLDLIMLANHKPVTILINGSLTLIEQGMYHTSILSLSERWSAHRKTVNGFLKLLENEAMITTVKSRKDGTTINICNYPAYQGFSTDTRPSFQSTSGVIPDDNALTAQPYYTKHTRIWKDPL